MGVIMATIQFDKMHGLGNDFVVIDARVQPVALTTEQIFALCNRRTGIGCDQLILLENSLVADLKMRIFNPDASEVEACGNATRCIVAREGRDISIETAGGLLHATMSGAQVSVNMGRPRFAWDEIPLAYAMDAQNLPLAWDGLSGGCCVNVGNPHVVFFLEGGEAPDYAAIGPDIEMDAVFPDRVNVNFARVTGTGIDLIVWERGAGLTQACGTGACATAVAAILQKRVGSPVEVRLPGGALTIEWQAGDDIIMHGPATHVFRGSVVLPDAA
jgi:diaminopimelate epimerase